jgi:ribosome biogenesis protein BMS1
MVRKALTMTRRGRTGFVIFGACELPLSASLVLSSSRAATLLAKKEALKRKYDAQYDDPEFSHLDFYSEKKDRIPDQLALNRADLGGIDTNSRNLIEAYRPGQYIRIQLTDIPCKLIENLIPYYRRRPPTC